MSWFRSKQEPETVICHACRHVVEAASAQPVKCTPWHCEVGDEVFRYFCPEHRVGYTSINSDGDYQQFFKQFEVDQDGTPKGYVKAGQTL